MFIHSLSLRLFVVCSFVLVHPRLPFVRNSFVCSFIIHSLSLRSLICYSFIPSFFILHPSIPLLTPPFRFLPSSYPSIPTSQKKTKTDIPSLILGTPRGWGPLPWIYVSEIFPTRTRHYGLSVASATQWLFSACSLFTYFPPSFLPPSFLPSSIHPFLHLFTPSCRPSVCGQTDILCTRFRSSEGDAYVSDEAWV